MIELDHIGIAVEDAEQVELLFNNLLSSSVYKTEEIASQGIRTHFISAGKAKLELLESLSPDSAVAKFIAKRKEGIHHMAFEVSNIQATWRRMQGLGYTPLSEPQLGANNKLIFFLHPKETHGMLIEFCQKQKVDLAPQYVPFKDGQLAYYELGVAHEQTVVVLHGAAGCTQMETELLARRLSAHYRVLALDFAGHGQSSPFTETPFSPGLFIENVRALFEHKNISQAHVFGFSLGGFIALAFAHRHPELVQRLAVHATNLIWDQQLVDTMLTRLDHENIKARSKELVAYLSNMHGSENWVTLFEKMKTYTIELRGYFQEFKGVEKTPIPTLVSAVDKDDLFTVHSPVFLYDNLPNSTLAIIPGQRHALQNVDLDQLTPLVVRHFSRK